jgi:phosphatidylserine/phosphatidylglycerophosphate/cardiolipin synthase-like enzyme
MKKEYSIEIRKVHDSEYLKVFLADETKIQFAKSVIEKCASVRKVNVTNSTSQAHNGDTLTIYGKPMFNIKEIEQEVAMALESSFKHIIIIPEQIVTEAAFNGIREAIKKQLSSAINTIFVCVAWFTDDELSQILISKKADGIDIKVIIYDDRATAKYEANLADIPILRIKAERHGIMHRKFCIIDNHVVITGSYNWTKNAAERNDENIMIVQDWAMANQHTREFMDIWNSNDK